MTDVEGYDDDWAWHEPIPDGPMHTTADLDGVLPCCDQAAGSLPRGEGMTPDPARVTCVGAVA